MTIIIFSSITNILDLKLIITSLTKKDLKINSLASPVSSRPLPSPPLSLVYLKAGQEFSLPYIWLEYQVV